jgi:hypothetical protein
MKIMKNKTLSLTLASLMSLQSVGFANTDRTDGIGEQAISTAKENLAALNQQMLLLDQSLARAEETITARDDKGGITNGLAVAGAGLGLGLSAMSYLTIRRGGEGAGLGLLFLSAFSIGASVLSMVTGLTSQALKPGANTKTVETQLSEAQKSVTAALVQAAQNKTTSVVLIQMNLALKNTQEALAQYQTQESEVSRNRLVSQASQLIGSALMVYGVTKRESRAPMIGALVMTAGNLASVISGLQGSQAEAVLKEIQKSRESLRFASAALQ